MKNTLLASALLFFATPASAGVSWVQGPFWQTAYRSKYSTSIQTSNAEISDLCRTFESTFLDEGYSGFEADDFQLFNEMGLASDMINPSFYLEMKINLPLSLILEDSSKTELSDLSKEKAKSDVIPLFTQPPAIAILRPESFEAPIRAEYARKSLSATGEKLGVPRKSVKVVRRQDGYHIAFREKDLVCDLLAGRANLKLDATIAVKIDVQDQIAVATFYDSVEKISSKVLDQTSSPKVRAALLGFRLGELLSKSASNEKAESQMLELLTKLFDETTVGTNALWTSAFGKKILSVDGTTTDVKALLELNEVRHAK